MKVTVRYWRGTTQHSGIATTYRGAMRLADRNQNAYDPHFYDDQGKELYDDGHGLRYPDDTTDSKGNLIATYAM